MPSSISRLLPFSPSTTPLQGVTYLLGIALFSISFLVFLNSSVSFVVTDLIGQKKNVGDVVGTLGFADELVALVACPAWGLASDRLGVRWVAAIGYAVIGLALALFVQARDVYPQLLLARVLFAVGASAAATMVTAILPSMTDDGDDDEADHDAGGPGSKNPPNPRHSAAFSVGSELTITPERYTRSVSSDSLPGDHHQTGPQEQPGKPSALAGFVGTFTGAGAVVALVGFLPLPAKFGENSGVTPGEAVSYSFYVVATVALLVALFVLVGLRNLKGEDGKGWKTLLGIRGRDDHHHEYAAPGMSSHAGSRRQTQRVIPYSYLLKDAILLGMTDSRIGLGYLGGFVARASTVAISLFIPLFVNTYFIDNGFCNGSPNDPSPELKKECRAAYVLSSILTGVAQLFALICAPLFGYLSRRTGRINYPIVVATVFGMVGYVILPQLSSPEIKDEGGRRGSPIIFLIVIMIGISQIGAIVCSLGSLGKGVLAVELRRNARERQPSLAPGEDESTEADPLIRISTEGNTVSRVHLKGSIAGVYSLCGGAAILLLTKLGGYLFDSLSKGAPFYLMAAFNGVLLVVTLCVDASRTFGGR